MSHKFILYFLLIITLSGCDSVYRYIFLPPERIEYTLVPDVDKLNLLNDTSYFVSKNGQIFGYNAKDWKIEVRYMSDYQLNTFEFPEESKDGLLSGNPYTYANWVDPELGYTPRRFSVFKVAIYNYTGSKLNFDPELATLETDRGDNFRAYAREQKNAKNFSLEEYFKRRQGSSGVEEQIFETRMGIIRRTLLYYGKPIYKGDSREGLVVFEPIVDNVTNLKVNIKNFIVGYDENNDPSDFINLTFYFKQVPLNKDELIIKEEEVIAGGEKDGLTGNFQAAILRYNVRQTIDRSGENWNPIPRAIPSLMEFVDKNTSLKTSVVNGNIDESNIKSSDIAFILGGFGRPEFQTNFIKGCADFVSEGKLLFIDNTYLSLEWPFVSVMDELLVEIQKNLSGKSEIKRINLDHPVFSSLNNINILPRGYDDYTEGITPTDHLKGLFLEGKLVAILSTKGFPVLWAEDPSTSNYDVESALKLGANLVAYTFKINKK